jgi:hypothetical protein
MWPTQGNRRLDHIILGISIKKTTDFFRREVRRPPLHVVHKADGIIPEDSHHAIMR